MGDYGLLILARQDSPERRLAVTSISLILATLALQSLVPVALADRYMTPALPFAVILAVIGMVLLTRMPCGKYGASTVYGNPWFSV